MSLQFTFSSPFVSNITDYKSVETALKAAVFRSTKINPANVLVATSKTSQLCGLSIPPIYSNGFQTTSLSLFGKAILEQEKYLDSKYFGHKRIHLDAALAISTISFGIVQNVPGPLLQGLERTQSFEYNLTKAINTSISNGRFSVHLVAAAVHFLPNIY